MSSPSSSCWAHRSMREGPSLAPGHHRKRGHPKRGSPKPWHCECHRSVGTHAEPYWVAEGIGLRDRAMGLGKATNRSHRGIRCLECGTERTARCRGLTGVKRPSPLPFRLPVEADDGIPPAAHHAGLFPRLPLVRAHVYDAHSPPMPTFPTQDNATFDGGRAA